MNTPALALFCSLATVILAGNDYQDHDKKKYRPHYNHEWVERQKIRENQEKILEELRRQRREENFDRDRYHYRDESDESEE